MMRTGRWRWLASGTAALALTGCATDDVVRIERAQTMVDAGREATGATQAVFRRTREVNRQVLIDLVAADPNCSLPEPSIIAKNAPKDALFCPEPGPGAARMETEPFKRIAERDFGSTLAVIKVLSGYLDEVDGIVTRDPVDIGAQLQSARSDLATIVGAAAAVTGSDDKLPELTADQQSAADGALALISAIVTERQKVGDLRNLETPERQAQFEATLTALERANNSWTSRLAGQLGSQMSLLDDRLNRLVLEKASEGQRRPVIAMQLETIEQRDGVVVLRAALKDTTAEFREAHRAYVALLFGDPNEKLTDAERRLKARIIRERVMGALKSLTAIIAAF